MSVRFALPAMLCLTIAALAAAPLPASAAPPPRVDGLTCTRSLKASAPKNTFWWATFQGERTGFFDWRETTFKTRCFRSQANCKAWLYWIQSDWPDMNQFLPCKRGFPF